ncbi:MAG: hypothetical protein WA709_21035, partial [Stellaceae bacterium]
MLYEDKAKGVMTCLLKWEPGATLPMHKHPEDECIDHPIHYGARQFVGPPTSGRGRRLSRSEDVPIAWPT